MAVLVKEFILPDARRILDIDSARSGTNHHQQAGDAFFRFEAQGAAGLDFEERIVEPEQSSRGAQSW